MKEQNLISKKQIRKIAGLARISLKSVEEEKFAKDIGDILDSFKVINKLELKQVKKFDHYKLKENRMREDKIEENMQDEKEGIKKNFPQKKKDYLTVKAVL